MRFSRFLFSAAIALLGAYLAWAAIRAHPRVVTGQFTRFPHPDGWITSWEKSVSALPDWMLPRHGDGAEYIWSIFYYLVVTAAVFTFVGVALFYRETRNATS